MIPCWRIGTDTPDYTAEDLSGLGAQKTGGRWNRKGLALVYCAQSRALACLETLVHLGAGALPLNRYLVQISIPDDVWQNRQILDHVSAPVGWDALPAGKVSLDLGDHWLGTQGTCLFEVPSVIIPEEKNLLINPLHPDAPRLSATKIRRWLYDTRVQT